MKDGIWLPIVAAGIFLVASTVIYNLVGASSAKPIIQGGLVGLLLAALNWPSNPGGVGWFGCLMLVVAGVALGRWVVMPLTGLSRDPMFAGFDGTNPAVLVPDLLNFGSGVLVYCSYALVARRRPAAD